MKRIIALTLAIVMCFCTACFSADASIINVAYYRDWNFTDLSAPEYVALTTDTDSISLWAECVNTPDEAEQLVAYVIGITHPGYSTTFDFDADGSVTTYPHPFPEGFYKVYIVGSEDVEKSYSYVIFTKVD